MENDDQRSDLGLSTALRLMVREDIERAWEELGDVAVDDDGCIDLPWRGYPAGTDRESIWDEFDAAYPGGLIALDPSLVGAERAPEGAFPIQTVPQLNANLASGKVDAVLAVPGMGMLLIARGYDEQAGTFESATSYETASEALHALQPSRFIDAHDEDPVAVVKVWDSGDVAEILSHEGYERSWCNVSELMRQAYDELDEKLDRAFDEVVSQYADFDRLPDQPEYEEWLGCDLDDATGKSDASELGLGALADLKGAESRDRGAAGSGIR